VLLAIAVGMGAGLKTIDQSGSNVGQAHKADQILKQGGFQPAGPLTEIVVIQSKQQTITALAFRQTVLDVVRSVAPSPNIHGLRSPLERGNRSLVSANGRTALVEWEMNGTVKSAEKKSTRSPGGLPGSARRTRASTSARPAP
jgi:hypothetical protein